MEPVRHFLRPGLRARLRPPRRQKAPPVQRASGMRVPDLPVMENCMISQELARLGLKGAQTRLLREKDGVLVARVQAGQAHYVLKCFRKVAYRR